MTFALSPETEVPAFTTVASYRIDRLGLAPQLVVRYAETLAAGVNTFGVTGQRMASTGRTWEVVLSSVDPAQLEYMAQLLGSVAFKVLKAGLTALGQTDVTDEQIMAAVAAMPDNIDSIIASSLETIEMNRQAGIGPAVTVVGVAPAVTPAE